MADVVGVELVIDIGFAGAVLPAWWSFMSAGTCRQSSLSMGPLGAGTYCPNWSAGNAVGGIGAYIMGARGPNFARIVMLAAVPPDFLQLLAGLNEYDAFHLAISHAKTVGTGSCGGCTTPACIVFESAKVTTPAYATDRLLTGPANLTDSDWATWQGGAGVVVWGRSGCPAATPTSKRTWGAVKSLYR